jgi:parallel beta-helix repeat protein
MKRLFIPLFALIASLCLSDGAQANTFYVATSGNNANPGSQAQPWLTLQHAVDHISPGDTILVASGTYAGCRIGHSGQPGAVCTLKADTGATVVVNTPGPNNRHSSNIEVELFDDTVRYWVIDGLESANSPRYGIDIRITYFITVQNCYVHGAAVTGIFLAFSNHPLIQNNESAFNGEHGIYDSNSADYPTIRGNRSHHNHSAGIHMNGDLSQPPGDGIISFAVVEKNIIYENGVGGGSGINCDGVSDSIFRNNLLYNNHASGISLYGIDGGEGSSRNKIYNNTIVMAAGARWCINIPASTDGQPDPTGNQIRNNILYTPDTGLRGSVLTYGSAVTGFTSDYNVVVNRFSTDGGDSTLSLAGWQALGYDIHSIIATPAAVFVDPAGNNYHLKAGSPAIGAGASLAEVVIDLDGFARPLGNPYAIGCYEGPSAACSVTLAPLSLSFSCLGGLGAIEVVAPVSCDWTATTTDGFIAINSGATGMGNGVVKFSVTASNLAVNRGGVISIAGQSFAILQGAQFSDVALSNPFFNDIGKLSAHGITLGCGNGNYCPSAPVTRDQMAAFIIRALGDFNPPPPPQQRFTDVPPANIFYAFIDEMASRGITLGCGGSNYCPSAPVTREQMAAFIIRALGDFNPPIPSIQRFDDVLPSNPFFPLIDEMAARGITRGCGGPNYCPSDAVTREQMAAFLVRAFNL